MALVSSFGRALALLVPLLIIPPLTSVSAQVRTLNLREMVGASGMIFMGVVSQAQGGTDEHGELVTYTTFKVERAIRGVPPEGVTIKQLGGEKGGLGVRLEHMRYFREGERVLVMLYPTSNLGFTSPVGLNQGIWEISNDGRVHGVSDGALQGLDPLLQKHNISRNENGAIPVPAFIALLGSLMQEGVKR